MTSSNAQTMQCMEVWGGNQTVDTSVAMSGLDAWVYCHPYGDVAEGGDVYYVSSCATGRVPRLLVADVSGHGSAVCKPAEQLRGLMREYVNYLDQTQFVAAMNARFAAMSEHGYFATALVTTFFAPTSHLSLCNAGHPPPLLFRAATGRWSFLEGHAPVTAQRLDDRGNVNDEEDAPQNLPLGILDLAGYEQFDVRLEMGDLVLCYTDSLIEAKAASGDFLDLGGLLEIVGTLDLSDPPTFIPRLLAAIAEQAPGNLTADDVTVLLFRPNGLAPRLPLREKLFAPLRVLSGVVAATRAGHPAPLPDASVANLGGALFSPLNRFWRGRGK